MQLRSYNKEIQIATAQIIDTFNDIVIDRRTSTDEIEKLIRIPCIYGQRSRILKSQENKNKTIKLPLMCISILSVARDVSRVHSVNDALFFSPDTRYDAEQNIAVPINIGYRLSIVTKFQEDMDQIISNFAVNMNPDIYVVWPSPKGNGNVKSQIVWDGSLSITYPEEINETTPSRIFADTQLIYKTWLFPGIGSSTEAVGRIKYINWKDPSNPDSGTAGNIYGWYDVRQIDDFNRYLDSISAGEIKAPNFDVWQLSGDIIDNEQHLIKVNPPLPPTN